MASVARSPAVDKRRLILDAAIRVFARQGFHACRVSDIADEAGVAYGLVYHYFGTKDEVLYTLFLERWAILIDAIHEVDRTAGEPREKLRTVTGFIVDSYRHDPDLMNVNIVEVKRAANSFGRKHLTKIREAYDGIADIVAEGQEAGRFRTDITPQFDAMAFYGAIEQVLTGWIVETLPVGDEEMEGAKDLVVETIVGGLRGSSSA